ncbi:MAG: TlpA family protein disulfide reductase, partial [Stellaceae bacterium]
LSWRRMIRIFLIAILLSLASATCFAAEPELGSVAPSLEATELNGQTFDLAAERGKVVIVNFWATWCGPCRTEMPALDAFYRAFRGEGLVLIGISVDKWDDKAKVAATMKPFSYPAAMVNEARENEFPRPKAIPTTYIIDRGGVLRAIEHGATPESLAKTVLPLLKQKPPPAAPSGMSASLP